MTPLWFGAALLLVPGGIIFQDPSLLIAGAFSFGMALVGAVVRDYGRNKSASANLAIDTLNRQRVGYEDDRKAA